MKTKESIYVFLDIFQLITSQDVSVMYILATNLYLFAKLQTRSMFMKCILSPLLIVMILLFPLQYQATGCMSMSNTPLSAATT